MNFQIVLANKYIQIGGIALIIINILVLNVVIFSAPKQTSTTTNASAITAPTNTQQSTCASCDAQINQVLTKIKNIETALSATPKPTSTPAPIAVPTAIPTPTPTRTITATPTPTSTGIKEYYIPLGSGNSSSSNWTDVSGLQVSIDTALYPSIKTATFEVAGHTPTGNETIWVRLYNSTDNYPIPNSEITWSGGSNQFIISNPITLASGNKTYKVQMKTQLSYTSNIDFAKIHLILY